MPKFYRDKLSKTLLAAVQDALEEDATERNSLDQELALAREAAGESVRMFAAAHEAARKHEETPEGERNDAWRKRHQALVAVSMEAGACMVDSLKSVEHFVSAIARIDAQSKNRVNIVAVQGVTRQMVRLMHEVCGEDNMALAERFEQLVATHISIPIEGPGGTTLTPDADALDMDATIPRVEGAA